MVWPAIHVVPLPTWSFAAFSSLRIFHKSNRMKPLSAFSQRSSIVRKPCITGAVHSATLTFTERPATDARQEDVVVVSRKGNPSPSVRHLGFCRNRLGFTAASQHDRLGHRQVWGQGSGSGRFEAPPRAYEPANAPDRTGWNWPLALGTGLLLCPQDACA